MKRARPMPGSTTEHLLSWQKGILRITKMILGRSIVKSKKISRDLHLMVTQHPRPRPEVRFAACYARITCTTRAQLGIAKV